ncbi:hypothetical protein BDQ17DRAFT_1392455 [Cyathus striatus]|nr:hypothetical protein BDQ17DRAFT_1392455 [Cyathus striatus]
MVVIDGIVMGPQHCAYDNCSNTLVNHRGGVFCDVHNQEFGARCHVCDCQNQKIDNTQACNEHQEMWHKYNLEHSSDYLNAENPPWNKNQGRRVQQLHDESDTNIPKKSHYFSASHYYCVETICAPCGAVIAWTKFVKSDGLERDVTSTTNILKFLEDVFPDEELRPDYICIDKACKLLQTAVANGSWVDWFKSSHFVVDGYHYTNHCSDDYLCRKWCNPAPQDGSAPNLVYIAQDRNGERYHKRAFNTQACEQLNSWLGGFESIMKRMTPSNFNWFIHSMIFYHTQQVIKRQNSQNFSIISEDFEYDDGLL